jgi:replication-associated recombination protein RarA
MIALTERYRPRKIADFAGLHRAKKIMTRFVASPHSDAFLAHGPSGVGKTTFWLAVAAELGCSKDRLNLIHVPAAECSVEKVRWIREITESAPMFGQYWCVIVDECDRMSPTARVAFLSLLDATGMPERTVFLFTSNETPDESDRFISRCKVLSFDDQVPANDAISYLYKVFYTEAPSGAALPEILNPASITARLTEKKSNIRSFLNDVELELMAA